jgi:hypothetical protein
MTRFTFILLLAISILSCDKTRSGNTLGDLDVTVKASNGQPLVGATVTIPSLQISRTTTQGGKALFVDLPEGTFDVTATMTYLNTLTKQSVTIKGGELTKSDLVILVNGGGGPHAIITKPNTTARFGTDDLIDFSGAGFDDYFLPSTLNYNWISNIDGVLSSGSIGQVGNTSFNRKLSFGIHTVIFSITNSIQQIASDTVVVDVTGSSPVRLDSLISDYGKIKLRWNKAVNLNLFSHYEIERQYLGGSFETIKTIQNRSDTCFIDTTCRLVHSATYRIQVVENTGLKLVSNEQMIIEPRGTVVTISDLASVLKHPDLPILYLFGEKKIYEYDYEKRFVRGPFATVEHFWLAKIRKIGNDVELLIPKDEQIYVYDASSFLLKRTIQTGLGSLFCLAIKDQFYVTSKGVSPKPLSSRRNSNDQFISTADPFYSGSSDFIDIVSAEGYYDFFALTYSSSPSLVRFQIDATGKFTSYHFKSNSSNYSFSQTMHVSPSSDYLISYTGQVFGTTGDMDYIGKILASYHYCFNTSGSIVYGADLNNKAIKSFGFPSLNFLQAYTLTGYPWFVFRDGNRLVVLSTQVFNVSFSSPLDIEIINL